MRNAELEVMVHLAVRIHIYEPWKSELDLDRSIALPGSVWPWLGRELRLRGSLMIRGGAEGEGTDLRLFWRPTSGGEGLNPGVGSTVKEIRWKSQVTYGPRSNLELVGIDVQLVEFDVGWQL